MHIGEIPAWLSSPAEALDDQTAMARRPKKSDARPRR
jgi:hypothetical protein